MTTPRLLTDEKQKAALIRLRTWVQDPDRTKFQIRRKIDELLPKYEESPSDRQYHDLLYFGLTLLYDELEKRERLLEKTKIEQQAVEDFTGGLNG